MNITVPGLKGNQRAGTTLDNVSAGTTLGVDFVDKPALGRRHHEVPMTAILSF